MARSSDSAFPLSLLNDKTFQASEIRRVITLSLIYLAVTTLMVGLFYYQLLGSLIEGVAPMLYVAEDAAMINEAIPALGDVLGKWVLGMLAVNTLITICIGIFITKRLGQPIMAIKRSLREIGAGNLDVRLRDTDSRDFGEISREVNLAMRTVRSKVAEAKQGIEKAAVTDSGSQEDVIKAIETCRAALDYFQVETDASLQNQNRSS